MTLCGELGIGALTIYAFSQENWKRPVPEINALMMLLEHYLQSEMDALIEKGVRFRAIGRVIRFHHRPFSGCGKPNGKRSSWTN